MTDLFLFIAASIGMTHIFVESYLFQKPRDFVSGIKQLSWLGYMWNCYQCSGMWLSILCGYLIDPCPDMACLPVRLFLYGCAGSYLATVAASLNNYLDVVSSVRQ